jgi:hypothetical protein
LASDVADVIEEVLGMGRLMAVLAVSLSIGCACALLAAEKKKEEKIPKRTIKEVMALAHKPPVNLLRKVAQGKASKKEKEELVKLYKALAPNKPPRGEKADWDKRTAALTAAAEGAVRGEKDAGKKLTKVGDCMACHKAHKPK